MEAPIESPFWVRITNPGRAYYWYHQLVGIECKVERFKKRGAEGSYQVFEGEYSGYLIKDTDCEIITNHADDRGN